MTEVAKLPRSEVVSSSAMDQRGYLSWVNSTLDTNLEKVEEMCTGVAYCQLMHRMFPDSISLIGVKFDARSEQEYRNNFTIMKQCFSQLKVNKSLPIALLCRGNFLENFDFLKWFKAFFDVNTEPHSDNNPCEERESSHFLQPNNAQYLSTQLRRSITPTPRSTSPMMNCVPPQSATPEPPSWSQRATSPFGGSVPSQNAHRAPRDGEEHSHFLFEEHFLESEDMKKVPEYAALIRRGYNCVGVFRLDNYVPLRAVLFQVLTCWDVQRTVLSLYTQESVLRQLQAHQRKYTFLLETWEFGNNTELKRLGTPIQSLQQCIRTFFATVDRVSKKKSCREKRALLVEEMGRKEEGCRVDLMLMECVKFLMFSLAEKWYLKQATGQKVPDWFSILNITNRCDSFDEYFRTKLNKYGGSLRPDQGELNLVGISLNVRVKLFDMKMLDTVHFEKIHPSVCYKGPELQISLCTCDYRCYAVMYKSDIISVPKLSTANSFCNSGAAVDVGLCRMGGYDFQFCGNIDGFCCLLCHKVMREPIQIPCGHHYCKSCISDYVKTDVNCRGCNREIVSNFIPDTHMQNRISNLTVRCLNLRCSCVCSLSSIENHLQVCNMNSIECEYCGELVEVQYLNQHRNPSELKCQKMPRNCPYDCPQTFTLEDLKQHLEDNVVQHAQYQQRQLSELKSENNSLKKQLQSLQQSYFETKVTPTLSEENWDHFREKVNISTNGTLI